MSATVRVTFGARALVAANDGLDPESSAQQYAEALRGVLAREWPDAAIDVTWTGDRAATRAEVTGIADENEARARERTALDLAWVTRQMLPWGT